MSFQLDPFYSNLFVFCNRKRDKLKILHWDHNGFWLYYRRLEKGVFQWPDEQMTLPLSISPRQFNWLLDGLLLEQKQAYPKMGAKLIIIERIEQTTISLYMVFYLYEKNNKRNTRYD